MEIYYLRNEFFEMGLNTDKITIDNICKTHVRMPKSPKLSLKDLDIIFAIYNDGGDIKNPLTTPENQDFIRNMKTHTSMSVGDVVEIDNKFYVCECEGWRELQH